jgi:hypothetical protein
MTTLTRLARHSAILAATLAMLSAPAFATAAETGKDLRPTVARLITAAVEISPQLARLEAGLQMVPGGSVLTSGGELRPADALGPWARSRGYERVTPELGDALAEGSAPDATTREWTRCYQRGNGAYVVCPDGFIEVN